jgi:hypothetical protein
MSVNITFMLDVRFSCMVGKPNLYESVVTVVHLPRCSFLNARIKICCRNLPAADM